MATEQALDFSINALKESQLTPPSESRSRISSGSSERTSPALSAHSPSPQFPTSTTTHTVDPSKPLQFPNPGLGTAIPPVSALNQFSPFTLSALLAAKSPLSAGYTSSVGKLGLSQFNPSDPPNVTTESAASLLGRTYGNNGLPFPSFLPGSGLSFGEGMLGDPMHNQLLAKHLFGGAGNFMSQDSPSANSAFLPTSPMALSAALKNRRRNIVSSRSPGKVSPMKRQQSVTPGSEKSSEMDTQESPNKEKECDSLGTTPNSKKDEAYWERRRRNNEAAKRSRDARRAKEEEIAMRATILEQENLKLRAQVAILKNETAKLHLMLFSNAQSQRNTANEA